MPSPKTTAQPATPLRRKPLQARAQQTIQTLFRAAAQILDRDGEAGLNTNRVAQEAGYSIGTLYQYFPSKEALLGAMAAQGRDLVLRDLEALLTELEARPDVCTLAPQAIVQPAMALLVRGFAAGRGLGHQLVRLCWTLEQPDETLTALRQVADRLAVFLERIRHPRLPPPPAATLFVLTRSVIGTLRSASLERSPLLKSPALEDTLVRLALALLETPNGPSPTAPENRIGPA